MWAYIESLWNALPLDKKASAVFQPLGTLMIWVLGAFLLLWQIRRQFRNAIKQNLENEKQKLKLQVYETFVPLCTNASNTQSALASFLRSFSMDLSSAQITHHHSKVFIVPSATSSDLLNLRREMMKAAIELLNFIERWAIIDLRMNIFKTAINAALEDISTTLTPYFQLAARAMPFEKDSWTPPDESFTKALEPLADNATNALITFGSYLFDFQAEMQNLLLGELFSHRVPPRSPVDPKHIVVTLDRHDELAALFARKQH